MFRIPSLRQRYILSIRKGDFKLPSEMKRNLMLSDTEKEKKFLLISMYPLLRKLEDQERAQQILVEKK